MTNGESHRDRHRQSNHWLVNSNPDVIIRAVSKLSEDKAVDSVKRYFQEYDISADEMLPVYEKRAREVTRNIIKDAFALSTPQEAHAYIEKFLQFESMLPCLRHEDGGPSADTTAAMNAGALNRLANKDYFLETDFFVLHGEEDMKTDEAAVLSFLVHQPVLHSVKAGLSRTLNFLETSIEIHQQKAGAQGLS